MTVYIYTYTRDSLYIQKKVSLHFQKMHVDEKLITLFFS